MLVVADADQIDVAFAVDLAAGEEEHIDAALPGAVEQLASAVGEEHVPPAAEQRDVGLAAAALAQRERRERRDRRGIADRDMPHVADQPHDRVGEQFFGEELPLGHLISPQIDKVASSYFTA